MDETPFSAMPNAETLFKALCSHRTSPLLLGDGCGCSSTDWKLSSSISSSCSRRRSKLDVSASCRSNFCHGVISGGLGITRLVIDINIDINKEHDRESGGPSLQQTRKPSCSWPRS